MAIFRGAYTVIATVLLAVVPAMLYASESPGSITVLQRAMQSAELEVSARCRNHTLFYVQELHRGEPWALKMFDSSAKPESGVFKGGLTFLGFYSECLETLPRMPVTHESEATKTSPPFASQYCLLTVGLPDQDSQVVPVNHVPGFLWDKIRGKDVRFGICTPSTCTEEDVSNIGSQLFQQVGATKNTTYSECTSGDKEYVPIPTFLVVTFIFLAYAALVAVATAYDMKLRCRSADFDRCGNLEKPGTSSATIEKQIIDIDEEERGNRALLAFSIITNAEKLFNVRASSNDSINAIHGIRALTINLIVFGHTALFTARTMVYRNPDDMNAFLGTVAGQIIYTLLLTVDTFFFLTGFLVVYLTLNRLTETKGKMNWWFFYLHRYWRLTPTIALVTLFYVVYLPYCGDGPLWGNIIAEQRHCKANWWANILYVQNFLGTNERCVIQTWYVAADFQFYLISPPIIYALYRKPRVGISVIGLLFTVSVAYTVTTLALKELPFVQLSTAEKEVMQEEYAYYMYQMPLSHIGPYLVGMITGYIVHNSRGQMVMKKRYVCAGWSVCTVLVLGLVLAVWLTVDNGDNVPLYVSAVYRALSRSIWATCIAWILICCIGGYGGPVNALLSFKLLVPLSRLTFVVYLVHVAPMIVFTSSRQQSFHYSGGLVWLFYAAFLVLSYVLALVVSVVFEAPIFNVEKILLAGKT